MDTNMANVLVLVLLLLLLESTVTTVPFQECCPEDDKHVFIQEHNICNSSQTLGLVCNNNSGVVAVSDGEYWFEETSNYVILGSKDFGMILSHESFCVANITPLYSNWKRQIYSDGIVLCMNAEAAGTYLGAELVNYVVCTMISGIGCFLTFLTYIVVPALRRDLLNKCLICALLCFTFAYVTFAVTLKELHMLSRHYCAYQFLFLLFWATAAVFWTNVVSFHIWRTIVFERFPVNEARLSKVYHFWGWGVPLILSVTATSLEALAVGGGLGFATCSIHSTYAFMVMMVPFPILLFFNVLYFIWTMWKLCRQEAPSSSDQKFTRGHKCFLYLKLFLVTGIQWVVRCITNTLPGIATLMDTLALLQGLFIFLVLVVFQKKAYLGLAEQFAKWGYPCPFVTTDLVDTRNEECNEDGNDKEALKNPVMFNAEEIKIEA